MVDRSSSRVAIEVRGHEQLMDLAARLRDSGNAKMRRKLLRGLREAVRPTMPKIRLHARAILPHEGGLNEEFAAKPIATRTSLSLKKANVRLVSNAPGRLRDVNAGKLRHPVFGNRRNWVSQTVEPGWFDGAIKHDHLRLRLHVMQVIRQTAREIEGH